MKRNETSQLIDGLAKAVHFPSESHLWRRAFWLRWSIVAALFALLTYRLAAEFPDVVYLPLDPFNFAFLSVAGLWLLLAFLLIRLAYLSAVPLSNLAPAAKGVVAACIALLGVLLFNESPAHILSTVGTEMDLWRGPCGVLVFSTGLLAGTMLTFSLRRAAPTRMAMSGMYALAACGSLSSFFMTLICRHENGAHVLLWHALPILILALLGVLAGLGLLKQKFARL